MFDDINQDMLRSPEVTICVVICDDSGSILESELTMVNATNGAVEELLLADGGRDKYWLAVMGLNRSFVRPMGPITPGHKVAIDEYKAHGATPLYQRTLAALMYQKSQRDRLSQLGIRVRTATIVLTAGFDISFYEGRKSPFVHDLRSLALDMSASPHHQLIGVGILTKEVVGKFPEHVRAANTPSGWFGKLLGGGQKKPNELLHETEYHYVFEELMGFSGPGALVIAAKQSSSEVAKAMRQASQAIARGGLNVKKVATGF